MADELPRVLALLTATSVEHDGPTNTHTIRGVTKFLLVGRLPVEAPLGFYVSLDGVVGRVPVMVRLVAPSGEVVHAFGADADFRDREHVINLPYTQTITFREEGCYRVQVLAHGSVLLERTLAVEVARR